MDWISKLDLGRWWKVLIGCGVAITVAALAVNDRVFATIGLGMIGVGFGEWFNHPKEMQFYARGILTTYERKNRVLGIVLDTLGCILIFIGVVRLAIPQ